MIKVIVEDSVPYLKGLLDSYAEATYLDNKDITPTNIQGADALIVRSITRCNAELLESSSIQFIATATAGTDHIDASYCTTRGISWASAPGCNARAVVQYVFSALSRLGLEAGESLWGKTIGIIGVGNVGRRVAELAEVLGMRTLLYDPPRALLEGQRGFTSLEHIQSEADIITLHVPLSSETKHLVNDDFLTKCRRKPILINACRGAVCNSEALIRAKEEALISHLVIDCWEGEPHINRHLLSLSDIATPHIAGFSADGKHRGARMALLTLSDHFGLGLGAEVLEPRELHQPDKIIRLEGIPSSEQIAHAFLSTFDPQYIDAELRADKAPFEYLRKHYDYPREMQAHSISGAKPELYSALTTIGFTLV